MGAINLASGNIITLGYDDYRVISGEELREWAIEEFETNEYYQELYTLDEYIKLRAEDDYDEMIADMTSDLYRACKSVIDELRLFTDLINVLITPGYYSGFSVTVDIDTWKCFNDYNEKEPVMNDVKDIQEVLNKLVDSYNLNVVHPWWCTTWENYEESKKAIKKAMAELRRKIKAIPCYSRYRKVV